MKMKITKILSAALFMGMFVSSAVMASEAPKAQPEADAKQKSTKNSFMVKRLEGSLPSNPWDESWNQVESITFPITGQAAIQPRLFTSSAKEIKVWSAHNDNKISILVEYADESKDLDVNGNSDAAAIMFPIEPLPKRAHIYMGEPMLRVESSYANIWHWKAKDNKAFDLKGEGIVGPPLVQESQDVTGVGEWKNNKWRVMFTRDMVSSDPDDATFVPTQFANVSFATWDAIKGETKSMHGMSAWYYLVPEAAPDNSIYMFGLVGVVVAGVLEFAFVKTVQKKRIDNA